MLRQSSLGGKRHWRFPVAAERFGRGVAALARLERGIASLAPRGTVRGRLRFARLLVFIGDLSGIIVSLLELVLLFRRHREQEG